MGSLLMEGKPLQCFNDNMRDSLRAASLLFIDLMTLWQNFNSKVQPGPAATNPAADCYVSE